MQAQHYFCSPNRRTFSLNFFFLYIYLVNVISTNCNVTLATMRHRLVHFILRERLGFKLKVMEFTAKAHQLYSRNETVDEGDNRKRAKKKHRI